MQARQHLEKLTERLYRAVWPLATVGSLVQSWISTKIEGHVQADRPVEHDTFVCFVNPSQCENRKTVLIACLWMSGTIRHTVSNVRCSVFASLAMDFKFVGSFVSIGNLVTYMKPSRYAFAYCNYSRFHPPTSLALDLISAQMKSISSYRSASFLPRFLKWSIS